MVKIKLLGFLKAYNLIQIMYLKDLEVCLEAISANYAY